MELSKSSSIKIRLVMLLAMAIFLIRAFAEAGI